METPFTRHAGISVPLICGPMYPCSNPELVAAVSEAGGLGVIQPISLTYVHGHEFRAGLRYIRSMTSRPVGFNALIEASSKTYLARMHQWIDVALEEGVRFFITSLGDPKWVCQRVHAAGGVVYHDVTEARWARKGADGGVDGLIAVNERAGGHAGSRSAEALLDELRPFGGRRRWHRNSGGLRAASSNGLRRGATRHTFHRDAGVPCQRCLQTGNRGSGGHGHRPYGTADGSARGCDPQPLDRAARHAGRALCALDAARSAPQALDAHVLHAQLRPALA
jgi:Nitronate monooxygenase